MRIIFPSLFKSRYYYTKSNTLWLKNIHRYHWKNDNNSAKTFPIITGIATILLNRQKLKVKNIALIAVSPSEKLC